MSDSRLLFCRQCGDPVEVYELPVAHLDPLLYVCGDCLKPVRAQREFVEGHRVETVPYNPSQSEIPL